MKREHLIWIAAVYLAVGYFVCGSKNNGQGCPLFPCILAWPLVNTVCTYSGFAL